MFNTHCTFGGTALVYTSSRVFLLSLHVARTHRSCRSCTALSRKPGADKSHKIPTPLHAFAPAPPGSKPDGTFGAVRRHRSHDCLLCCGCGCVTVIFAQHVERGRQEKTVTLLTGFRNYLHYHLKATKTYMHMRMRKRVVGLLQGEFARHSSSSSSSCGGFGICGVYVVLVATAVMIVLLDSVFFVGVHACFLSETTPCLFFSG